MEVELPEGPSGCGERVPPPVKEEAGFWTCRLDREHTVWPSSAYACCVGWMGGDAQRGGGWQASWRARTCSD